MPGPNCTRCSGCGTPTCNCCTIMAGSGCDVCRQGIKYVGANCCSPLAITGQHAIRDNVDVCIYCGEDRPSLPKCYCGSTEIADTDFNLCDEHILDA